MNDHARRWEMVGPLALVAIVALVALAVGVVALVVSG